MDSPDATSNIEHDLLQTSKKYKMLVNTGCMEHIYVQNMHNDSISVVFNIKISINIYIIYIYIKYKNIKNTVHVYHITGAYI